jgi:hypothetical protein
MKRVLMTAFVAVIGLVVIPGCGCMGQGQGGLFSHGGYGSQRGCCECMPCNSCSGCSSGQLVGGEGPWLGDPGGGYPPQGMMMEQAPPPRILPQTAQPRPADPVSTIKGR